MKIPQINIFLILKQYDMTVNGQNNVDKTIQKNQSSEPQKEIANVISLLLQPEADFINCSIVYCDGGESRSGSI